MSEHSCDQCTDCPACDGMGYTQDARSELYELAPGVISVRCLACMGEGVYCPARAAEEHDAYLAHHEALGDNTEPDA